MTTITPGEAVADPCVSRLRPEKNPDVEHQTSSRSERVSVRRRPVPDQNLLWVQLGSLCLCVSRQTLPGWHHGSRNPKPIHVQAIDFKQEGDLDESALTKTCLA